MIDMPLPEEEVKDEAPEIPDSNQGYIDVQEGMEPKTCYGLTNPLTNDGDTNWALASSVLIEAVPGVSATGLTPSTSVSSHACGRGYPVLVDIRYPFKKTVGALRYIDNPGRQGLLGAAAQVWTMNELPNDSSWFIKSLRVRKGDTTYDVLGYPQEDISSLLDEVLESEKLIKIECIYSI